MLVLTRKKGESVVIGDNVRVTVVAIQGGAVRLGFVAPDELPIHREEIHRRIEASSASAGPTGPRYDLPEAPMGTFPLHA